MTRTEPRDPQRSRGSVALGAAGTHTPTIDTTDGREPRDPAWWLWALGLTVVLAVVAAAVLRALLGPVFLVPSASMEPTLRPGDRVRVDSSVEGGQGLRRGDVVVFDGAGSLAPYTGRTSLERGLEDVAAFWGLGARQDVYVKRVVGLAGDRVECCDDQGRITVDGQPFEEPYLGRTITADDPASRTPFSFEVPAGRMVVLGDNREASVDSRSLLGAPGGGLIPVEKVTGRVESIAWPWTRRQPVPASEDMP